MKISERTLRISAASFIALLMMGTAYVVSGPSFFRTNSANAESTEELLKAYASKDTDSDGLPDWQEALYGTDPNKAISNSFGISDGDAVKQGKLNPSSLASQLPGDQQGTTSPLTDEDFGGVPAPAAGSITEQFSREFFQEYIQTSNGQPMDADTQQALIDKLLKEFSAKSAASFSSRYSLVSLHLSNQVVITGYVEGVESILKANEVSEGAGDPVELMDSLMVQNHEDARGKLSKLSAAYKNIRDQLLVMQVPPSLGSQHLKLIQSFDSLYKATSLITVYEKDPLAALGAMSTYQPASSGVIEGLRGIATAVLASGEPGVGEPGSYIISAVRASDSQ